MTEIGVIVAVDVEYEAHIVAQLVSLSSFAVVRRPADGVELLAAAHAGVGEIVILSPYFPDVDAETVRRLHDAGVKIVGFGHHPALFEQWRIEHSCGAMSAAQELESALQAACTHESIPPQPQHQPWAHSTGAQRHGKIIAVWGTGSAPGRSTIANCLASMLARDYKTVLVDADTVHAAQAVLLGLHSETPQLAGLVRSAHVLTTDAIAEHCSIVHTNFHVISGLARSARWPEIKPGPLRDCLLELTRHYDAVVVDVSDRVDPDDDFADPHYDRHCATRTVLDCAHSIVTVCAGEPLGLRHMVNLLGSDRGDKHKDMMVPVVNKTRAAAVGTEPEARIRATLGRFTGITGLNFVPWCPGEVDQAVLEGRAVVEKFPHGSFATALAEVLAVLPMQPPVPTRNQRNMRVRRGKKKLGWLKQRIET